MPMEVRGIPQQTVFTATINGVRALFYKCVPPSHRHGTHDVIVLDVADEVRQRRGPRRIRLQEAHGERD